MKQYRIKIEERNNGEKRYIPQFGVSKLLKLGWTTNWENIIKQHGYLETSNTMTMSYDTEEDALKIIEEYKKSILQEEGRQVKSTTYKIVE